MHIPAQVGRTHPAVPPRDRRNQMWQATACLPVTGSEVGRERHNAVSHRNAGQHLLELGQLCIHRHQSQPTGEWPVCAKDSSLGGFFYSIAAVSSIPLFLTGSLSVPVKALVQQCTGWCCPHPTCSALHSHSSPKLRIHFLK